MRNQNRDTKDDRGTGLLMMVEAVATARCQQSCTNTTLAGEKQKLGSPHPSHANAAECISPAVMQNVGHAQQKQQHLSSADTI